MVNQQALNSAIATVLQHRLLPSEAASRFNVPKRTLYRALRDSETQPHKRWQILQQQKAQLEQRLMQINKALDEKIN
ncbi:helix-turn-helix domain-containing protein [Pseudoalteromonas sp. T1lg65]|uniref:helix-turn-helix domain-containing protein n=1 Tax=Pseudoalteromonas sp. T1lg65 TaxID=2077101 RepID=UPI003F7AEED0